MGITRKQHVCLYIALLDFVKSFHTINRNLLFFIFGKLGCLPKLIGIIKKLYTDVLARLVVDGELTQSIEYNSGVKQGCKLAPRRFGMYAAVLLWLALKKINPTCSVQIKFCYDGDLFDLHRLTAKIKVLTAFTAEAHQCADDIAIFHNARGIAVRDQWHSIVNNRVEWCRLTNFVCDAHNTKRVKEYERRKARRRERTVAIPVSGS